MDVASLIYSKVCVHSKLMLLLLLYRSHTLLNLSTSKSERRTRVKRMVLRNVVEIDEEKTAVSTCAPNM